MIGHKDSPYVQEDTGRRKTLCRMLVVLVEVGLSAARDFFGKTPPKHAAEPRAPRNCPGRPRTPQRLAVRVRVRVTVH